MRSGTRKIEGAGDKEEEVRRTEGEVRVRNHAQGRAVDGAGSLGVPRLQLFVPVIHLIVYLFNYFNK